MCALVFGDGTKLSGRQAVEHSDDLDRRQLVVPDYREPVSLDLSGRSIGIHSSSRPIRLSGAVAQPGVALFHRQTPDESRITQLLTHSPNSSRSIVNELDPEADRSEDERLDRRANDHRWIGRSWLVGHDQLLRRRSGSRRRRRGSWALSS